MCGVFGFVARGSKSLDLQQLKRIAVQTETRGHHAFGFAWIDKAGRMKMFKQTGRISDHLSTLNMARDARMLIGHCRWATHGAITNLNNHPHPVDGGWLVHNGVIGDYQAIAKRHGFRMVSECDTEILGHLVEHCDGTLASRCRWAVNQTRYSPLVMLGLWKHPRRLVVVRRGNPLYLGLDDTGSYLGSCIDDLPGQVSKVIDNRVLEFRQAEPVQAYTLAPPSSQGALLPS